MPINNKCKKLKIARKFVFNDSFTYFTIYKIFGNS